VVLVQYDGVHIEVAQALLAGPAKTLRSATIEQPVHAIMSRRHPLAKQKQLRSMNCLGYPLALLSRPYGVRSIMEEAATRLQVKLNPTIESDSIDFLRNVAASTRVISFQIKIGLPQKQVHNDMVYRPVNPEDVPPGSLHLAQLRERFLPVASARFAEQLMSELTKAYPNTHRKFTNKLADN
jgi:DNA-binding transcriptional LysR family regulator